MSNPFLDDEYFAEDDFYQQSKVTIVKNEERTKLRSSYEHSLENSLKKAAGLNGLKSSRFITGQDLIDGPENYFNEFVNVAIETSRKIRTRISETGQSEKIQNALKNATDEDAQNLAFNAIISFIDDEIPPNYKNMQKRIVRMLVINEIIGFSVIDPLWRDREIDEIIINGPNDIQVEIKGELFKVKSINFNDRSHLRDFLENLFKTVNKQVSSTTPLVKGRLADKSRLWAVHESVAPDGPTLNIRRHPEKHWTPTMMIEGGSASEEMMKDLGNYIYSGLSIAVMGGPSSGKTSMLNALTGFIPHKHRVITLEDSLELMPNPKKYLCAGLECVPARIGFSEDRGVTMRDLVKSATQMRPDVIIVGEVTDGAAYDLCQALNLGQSGFATVHANNEEAGIYRLKSMVAQSGVVTGNEVLPLIATAFDVIVQVKKYRDGARRISSISEVATEPERNESGDLYLPTRPLWKYIERMGENGQTVGRFEKVGEMSMFRKRLHDLDINPVMDWPELKQLSDIE